MPSLVEPGPQLFPQAARQTYLDTAAEGLPAPGVAEAFAAYHAAKQLGSPGRKKLYPVVEEARELTARLMGTQSENICFLSSASDALLALLTSLNWKAGDEVIISDLEFPSNIIPWIRLRQDGMKVTVVESVDGAIRLEDVVAAITPKTKLVSLSLVSYKTGAYFADLPELARKVHEVDGVLAVDATQALGRMPVGVGEVDFLFSSSFKWLMSAHGLGLTYVAPRLRERLDPRAIGWYSVDNCFTPDRFERYSLKPDASCLAAGMPNFPSLFALCASLRYVLGMGVESISETLAPLMTRLYDGVAATGASMLTPPNDGRRSGIVSFEHPDFARIGAELANREIIVWAGDGRVRASAHLYNDESHVDRFVEALHEILE